MPRIPPVPQHRSGRGAFVRPELTALLALADEKLRATGLLIALGAFNRAFVHTGLLPNEFTALLTRLFENRQSGDYDVLPGVTEAEARQDIADAQRIVKAVRCFLSPPPGVDD